MFKFIIADSGNAPTKYLEYQLKKMFGWTQEELENESDDDLAYYLAIIHNEKQRQDLDNE